MDIFPAIDLISGQAVRLQKGDYNKKTVYNSDPLSVARSFKNQGAKYLHIVDLDGAKSGGNENFEVISDIVKNSGLLVEVGGGIRSIPTIDKYISAGVMRVIIGTAAVTDKVFLQQALQKYGEKIAVGVDIKDSFVAIKGWTQTADITCMDFCKSMTAIGVKTIICTDISKDGMLRGTNLSLYSQLNKEITADIVASGGVSTLNDITALKKIGVRGAILGKALYTGNLDLKSAIFTAMEDLS